MHKLKAFIVRACCTYNICTHCTTLEQCSKKNIQLVQFKRSEPTNYDEMCAVEDNLSKCKKQGKTFYKVK